LSKKNKKIIERYTKTNDMILPKIDGNRRSPVAGDADDKIYAFTVFDNKMKNKFIYGSYDQNGNFNILNSN